MKIKFVGGQLDGTSKEMEDDVPQFVEHLNNITHKMEVYILSMSTAGEPEYHYLYSYEEE